MAQALVEYNYDAAQPDELTIRKGDIITDIVFNSTGWWEGTLTRDGKRGMFPDNFVKLMSDPDGLASSRQSPSGRKCKVLFSYKPANEDELELQVGDIIDIIAEVEEGWWKGKLKDRIGVFPSNFVEEITNRSETREASHRTQKITQNETSKTSSVGVQEQTTSTIHTVVSTSSVASESPPIDVPALPPKPVKEMCKVVYNYEAANPDELTLHEGDIITLITRDGQDPGWWKGEYKGKVGLFPDNFVQVISASEELSPVSKPDRPSKVLPTSKSKDSINKAMTSSMSNIASISRKYSDNVRQDEKPNLLSKKPVLPPPPLKKPQRSSSDLAKSPTAPNLLTSKHVDTSPTILHSVKPSSSTTTTTIRSSASNLENITVNSSSLNSNKRPIIDKSTDSLDGALWSKSGSYTVTSESSHSTSSHIHSSSSTIITSIGGGGDDLDLVGRAAMLTHPTASRVKAPKRRPPSTIYSGELNNGEESSETTTSSLSTSASSTTVTTMLNGDADAHGDKPSSNKVPWVEELKLINQAKKQAGNNKTRVMIGGNESSSSTVQSVTTSVSSTNISTAGSTSPEATKAPSVTAGVTLRSHPPATSGSTVPTPRPQSMVSSFKSLMSSQMDSSVTVPANEWNDILDKVNRMENQFESQVGSLTKTIKDLTAQLEAEKLRRHAMQREIDKLTKMVTQV